jgi:hypothetical protein
LIDRTFHQNIILPEEIAMTSKQKNEGVILEGIQIAGVEETIAPRK